MFSCFHTAYTKEKSKGLKDNISAMRWWDYLEQIEPVSPDFADYTEPKKHEECRTKIYQFTTVSPHFDTFIMIVIVSNLIVMGINFETSDDIYNNVLDNINLTFTSIFIIESILKIIALGPVRYFLNSWNQFDFFVVSASIIDLLVTNTTNGDAQILKTFQIIRVLRVLRVTR